MSFSLPKWKKIDLSYGRNLSLSDLEFEAARTIVLMDKKLKMFYLRSKLTNPMTSMLRS